MELRIGGKDKDYLSITILHRRPTVKWHYYDDLAVRYEVESNGLYGRLDGTLSSKELEWFKKGLIRLYKTLEGKAEFVAVDHHDLWCGFTLVGDGMGHIDIDGWLLNGELIDFELGHKLNKLVFRFRIDQTMLAETIASLDKIIKEYPFKKYVP